MSGPPDPTGADERHEMGEPATESATGPAGWPEPVWMERARGGATRVPGALPRGYSTTAVPTSRDLAVWVNLDVLFPHPPGTGGAPADPSSPDADDKGADEDQGGGWSPGIKEPGDVGSGVTGRGRAVCTGEVRGVLHRWERRVEGGWIAIVTYALPLAGDPRPSVNLNVAAVPEHAVRPVDPAGRAPEATKPPGRSGLGETGPAGCGGLL